jgi:hypothetical protein
MKLIHSISVLLFVLGTVASQLQFPEGDNIVANAPNNFGRGFDSSRAHSGSTVSKRQSTPYWYETIKHQGISAFGPGGYQVYRNVKDYGAKGKIQLKHFKVRDILIGHLLQVMASRMTRLPSTLQSMQADAVARDVCQAQQLLL